jgi:8-oxo-dGTP pyrophosphatase MutT (NUDIX family)
MTDPLFGPPPGAADPFTVTATRTGYANPWIEVEHRDVIRPDGKAGIYGIVRLANRAIGVLPLLADGTVPLVGQWRVPLGRYSWEIPEGGGPINEPALAAAQRELLEETGYTARQWLPLIGFDVSNSITDEEATVFLAYDLEPGEAEPDGTEVLHRRDVHVLDLLAGIDSGAVRDSLTVVAVLRLWQLATEGRLPEALARAILARPSPTATEEAQP